MESPPESVHFTPVQDCIIWAIRYLGSVLIGVYVLGLITDQVRGRNVPLTIGGMLELVTFVLCISVALGVLVFFFGWLGRVTISSQGIEAPRYSGFHHFMHWSDVGGAQAGSLSGWPCTVVFSRGDKIAVYLMVLGREKLKMIEKIRHYAAADNPLVEYLLSAGD